MSGPWVVEAARLHGERAAVRFEGRDVSWSALADEACALAGALSARGVSAGDLVAVHMAPHPRFVALLHAAQMLGAALLPLNLRLAPGEVERVLAHARPRLVVHDGAAALPSGVDRLHAFDELPAARPFAPPASIDADAALAVVYTSGTTSEPKGVVLSNASFAASAAASRRRLGHGTGDVWLAAMPLFHVGGLSILVRSVLEGSLVVLERGFDDARAAEVLASGDATMVSLVPTMLARVLAREGFTASPRLRAVLVGGAALSPALGRRALDAGLPISTTYGMTEACSQIATSEPGSDDAALGLVGRPLDGTEVRIDGADAEGWGEILVRGPTVARGYLRNEEATEHAFAGDWLRTGDLGRLEERGRLAVAGRRDDLIVSGGENVAPLEVERVLDEHPSVAESLVVGVPDEEWGQRVVALVVLREDIALDDDLRKWCRGRMAAYKVPREFRRVADLPRSPSGKPLRRSS